jgi:hypothetical protein
MKYTIGNLCRRCKQPFVSKHAIATVNGTAVTISRMCPDCAEGTGMKADVDMDCADLIRRHRLGTRLRDGMEILSGAR